RGVLVTTHTEKLDHEHLPGDGCSTVQHGDHNDHVHGGEQHEESKLHSEHDGSHTDGDGCDKVQHEDHVDHMHDGHRHYQHGDHVHEH
ncbi:MAG TPA: hypothetical protein VGD34_04345, partial [Kribbella sp.]